MADHALAQLQRAYDTVAESYGAVVADAEVGATLDLAMLAAFEAAVRPSVPFDVLDAGCGTGRLIPRLAAAGLSVCGCDLSSEMIRQARDAVGSCRFAVASIGALPWRDGSFGGVLSWYSVIHTDPVALSTVLTEFVRVLRPDGVLLLGFQSGSGARRIVGAYGHDVDLDAHLHDALSVAAMLAGVGLHVEATLVRAARPPQQHAQGFVMARKPGAADG